MSAAPQRQRAWAHGAEGEAKLAQKLVRWTADEGVMLLHDRRVPGRRANIDHLAIGPAGVIVIDAKRYRGRIAVERRGGLLREHTEHLPVGGRERTKLVDGVLGQAARVRAIARSTSVGWPGPSADGAWVACA
jgi:Nuclease-related domain